MDQCLSNQQLQSGASDIVLAMARRQYRTWRMMCARWATLAVLGVLISIGQATAQSSEVAHATYYGGADAMGTNDGSCGYANVFSLGYGAMTTALSAPLFNGGVTCGACFELKCVGSEACYTGNPSLVVTAANLCPQGSNGGWCDSPKVHFDLSQPAFASIAHIRNGWFPLQYRRVKCARTGGVRFTVNGHPFFNLVLIYNVGGVGDVMGVQMKGSESGWQQMARNWGQNWSDNRDLTGQALSFVITTSDGATLAATNVAPSNWRFGQTFEGLNF